MERLTTYVPIDRCHAMLHHTQLSDSSSGTALFADISGFTPLTEALLQSLGAKRGAEELTRQLNLVYDTLIPLIHGYRGSVVTFSGDAILCWFDGDDGSRAVASALAMQEAIAQFASTTTDSGVAVALVMKIAIASGPVRRFLVGDPAIQVMDVIGGSTINRLATAETLTRKCEIVLDTETITSLANCVSVIEWRTSPTSDDTFGVIDNFSCLVTVEPWPTLDLQQATAPFDVKSWILPPVYERLQAGQEQFLAEIRPAVTLFLQFSGIDYDYDTEAGKRFNAYICWVQKILERYEGFMLQVIVGDKGSYLYAAFGALLAHDDDPARAVAAALDLLALPPELSYIYGVRIGITRGLMHAGAYGSTTRHTYGVLGDEVNLAARLMARAEPGQILVSGRIAYNIRDIYQLAPIGMIQIKGKREPVPVSLVQGRQMPTMQRSTLTTPHTIIGRIHERRVFSEALQAVQAGHGRILRIEGLAGIGKSQLIAALSDHTSRRNVHVILGTCQSISQTIAYGPWRQIFWNLFGLSETEFDDLNQSMDTDELDTGQLEGNLSAADGSTSTRQMSRASRAEQRLAEVTQARVAQVEAQVRAMNIEWLLRLPLLGDLLGLPIPDNATTAGFDPRLRQEALFALIIDLLVMWVQVRPMLLVLEDIHWMDEASLDLTLAISRVITQMPVLMVLAQRPAVREHQPLLPELFTMDYHHHLPLHELDTEEVGAMVQNHLGAPASALLLSLVQYQAQGNPFFIEELIDALQETGKLQQHEDSTWRLADHVFQALADARCLVKDDQGAWVLAPNPPLSAAAIGIPDSVHGIVLSRLDRLPEEHKLTLKVASVIGRIFEFEVLYHVHPARHRRAVLLEQIHDVEARDFMRLEVPLPHLTYIFKHSITQEVAYDTLLESQQRELHQTVGATLERLQPDAVEQLAYHYSRSGNREKTLWYLERAAQKTQHEYANETALSFYTQALALSENWQWRRGQVEMLHILGRREEQTAALRILEADAGAPLSLTAHLWGQYYEAVGDYSHAQEAAERGLIYARQQEDELNESRLLSQLGSISRRQGDYEQGRSWYNQVLALFQQKLKLSDKETHIFIEILNGLGHIHLQQGNIDQAQAYFERALRLSRSSDHRKGEADALNNLGIMFRYQRHFAEALSYYQQALNLQRTMGDRAGEGSSLGNMAQVIQEAGDYGQARQYLQASLSTQQAIGNRWNEINDWNDLGILYQELGELDRAQECLEQGLQLSKAIGDEAGQAYILVNLGLVLDSRGEPHLAEELLTTGLNLAREQEDSYLESSFLSYLSNVNLYKNVSQAIKQAEAALEIRQDLELQLDTTYNLATLASAYLAYGDQARARDYAHEALAILDECGGEGPEFPQRDYLLCSQVLMAVGEEAAALQALQAAYDLVMARADKITDRALRQSFLETVPINSQIIQARWS